MMARACGCMQEFQEFAVDRYRTQRLAKFQKTRCSACVAKLNEEQQKAAALLPKKGEAIQLLPTGTKVSLTRQPDGSWSGTLIAEGTQVEAVGDVPHGVSITLARLWVAARRGVAAPAAKPTSGPSTTNAVTKPTAAGQAGRPAPQTK